MKRGVIAGIATATTLFVATTMGAAVAGTNPGTPPWVAKPLPPIVGYGGLPIATPLDYTPGVVGLGTNTTNNAYAMAQCRGVDFLGGQFSQVIDKHTSTPTTISRDSIVAFNPKSGVIDPNFHPAFKAPSGGPTLIESLTCSSDGTGLFIAGQFAGIDGTSQRAVARYNLTTDTLDTAFNANASVAVAHVVTILPSGDLFVGGPSSNDGVGTMVSLNQATGANTGYFNLAVTGSNVGNHYSSYQTMIRNVAVSPTATPDPTGAGLGNVRHIIVTGAFTAIGGVARSQVAMIALTPNHPTMSAWDSDQFKGTCSSSNPSCVKAVVYPPAGVCNDCFLLGADGGPHGTSSLWDGTSRFEQVVDKTKHNATWLNTENGDSIYALAALGPYVIIGGHERWENTTAGPAGTAFTALASPGIGALNISNGKPVRFSNGSGGYYTWNPLRSRGHGVNNFFVDPVTNALYVLSDGPQLGCNDPAGNIDCTRPTSAAHAGVSAKVAGCTSNDNFPVCIGEPLDEVDGDGALPIFG